MRRDMDIVRSILLTIEAKDSPHGILIEELDIPGVPNESDRLKHFISMMEAGLFACEPSRSSTNPDRIYGGMIFDLSWKGHEYLDTIRDPELWRETKKGMRKAGNASFEFMIELAKAAARRALNHAGVAL